MSEILIQKSCTDFVEALSTSAPVPGGGGVSALVGAIGVALGNMVASLTVGKPKYAAVEAEILQLKARSTDLQGKLLDMVERDAQVFEVLAKAYGMPSQTEEERAEKRGVMEQALANASAVPLEIMGLCMQALPIIERYGQIGSRLAVSDAGCAAVCCRAALAAAGLNVLINTKLMENRALADSLNDRVNTMLQEGTDLAGAIFAAVRTQLSS